MFPIVLPTLAERREDIPLLAEHFRRQIEEQEKAGVTAWDPAALVMLNRHDWPGNVRELRNVVHRAYVMAEGDTIREDVLESLLPGAAAKSASGSARAPLPKPPKSDKPAKSAKPDKKVAASRTRPSKADSRS